MFGKEYLCLDLWHSSNINTAVVAIGHAGLPLTLDMQLGHYEFLKQPSIGLWISLVLSTHI